MNTRRPRERVFTVVRQIPRGHVLTYKGVALLARVKNPRTVGQILHRNPDPEHIPCHRVVNRLGYVARGYAFGGMNAQAQKLRSEGVTVRTYKVDLHTCLWTP